MNVSFEYVCEVLRVVRMVFAFQVMTGEAMGKTMKARNIVVISMVEAMEGLGRRWFCLDGWIKLKAAQDLSHLSELIGLECRTGGQTGRTLVVFEFLISGAEALLESDVPQSVVISGSDGGQQN